MTHRSTALVLSIFILIGRSEAAEVSYASDIQPLFAEKCYECHGPDKQKGDLRLDDRESTLKSLSEDELIHRLTTDDPDEQMPPKGPRLSSGQIATIRSWADAGAPFEKHWAYRSLSTNPPPKVKAKDWVRNPIDQFVLSRLEQEKIAPSPEADRSTLIKRLYYDLTGLPPSPEAVDEFLADTDPKAYEKRVDSLLASPHFGERWGRHWLDKARYADSDGYEKDRPRPNAWHYRDWVIDAINGDMPMDQFTIEQLAGDLLPGATLDQLLATAFHRQTLTNTEGGTDKEEFRTEAVFDRTETTATIWLGLTMNCARCHNHKYDKIEQVEYYQLYDFFNNGDETTFKKPRSEAAMANYVKARAEHSEKLKAINKRIDVAKAGYESVYREWLAGFESGEKAKYYTLKNTAVQADVAGVSFDVDSAGVVLAGGENPSTPVIYHLEAATPSVAKPVTAIRLDALTHDSLPRKGPGRPAHGNFVISEIEMALDGKPLAFSAATADFSQGGWPVARLIDGKKDSKNGWAISNQMGKPHWAVLHLETPLTVTDGQKLVATLHQNYGAEHTVGRFQIRLMSGRERDASLPKELRSALAKEDRAGKDETLLKNHFFKTAYPATAPLEKEKAELVKKAPVEPVDQLPAIAQVEKRRETRLLERGSFLSPGDSVVPAGLTVLPEIKGREEGKLDRLDLANWLVSPENPLPPRVLANHVWEKLFGEGLVRTMNDFGVRGEKPTYPELLDWLGREYRRLGWSRKALIKTIVLSSTYRQSSKHREEMLERDPDNHLLYRQNRFRVEAEIARDLCLSVAGLISDKVGGPSVYPPLPPEVAALSYNNNFKWKDSEGEDRYRRGMYTFFKRTSPHPNLIAFDCPDSNTSNVKRRTSNTPIQALTMLNNEVYIEASQAFAKRILNLEAKNDLDRMEQAIRLCTLRELTADELKSFLSLLEASRKWYRENPGEAAKITGSHPVPEISAPENAAWVAVARIALNLDELITRE
ncbi:MAG: PSD1 and planctomycete cytochrome C domain-containing protein [Verrucomicrobiales bacterium]|nr:PSD1 and planctomycete cytochrome C domain-containing protein [Verrucomicrobiales bacterium]